VIQPEVGKWTHFLRSGSVSGAQGTSFGRHARLPDPKEFSGASVSDRPPCRSDQESVMNAIHLHAKGDPEQLPYAVDVREMRVKLEGIRRLKWIYFCS